jgi:hypothetical protein
MAMVRMAGSWLGGSAAVIDVPPQYLVDHPGSSYRMLLVSRPSHPHNPPP